MVEPTENTMVVTLRGRSPAPPSPDHACEAIGYDRWVTLDLPEPLRGRTVVDGASDEPKTISRAVGRLEPSWLPAGYDSFNSDVDSDTDSYVDRQVWARKDQAGKQVTIEQRGETVEKLGTPEGHERVVLERPTIRGRPAVVWKHEGFDDLICVSWNEDLRATVSAQAAPPATYCPRTS